MNKYPSIQNTTIMGLRGTLLTWTASLLLVMVTSTFALQAQSLVEHDIIAPIGSAWHMKALQVVPEEQILVDPIVWNYNEAVGNDVFGVTHSVLEPAQVNGSAEFPTADRVVRTVLDNDPQHITHTFYDVQAGVIMELGSRGPVLDRDFRAPAEAYVYPLEPEEDHDSWFCYTSSTITGTVDYCGTTRITLDAVGTLNLPIGTFTNVRRVTSRRATIPVPVEEGADSTILIVNDWYLPGVPYPLLHFTKLLGPDGTVTRTGQVLDENSLVGILERQEREQLQAYPNPSNGIVTVVTTPRDVQCEVVFLDGRVVFQERLVAMDGPRSLDLSGLPDGVYHLSIRDDVSVRSTKVVLTH
jgi:hypothetical protein